MICSVSLPVLAAFRQKRLTSAWFAAHPVKDTAGSLQRPREQRVGATNIAGTANGCPVPPVCFRLESVEPNARPILPRMEKSPAMESRERQRTTQQTTKNIDGKFLQRRDQRTHEMVVDMMGTLSVGSLPLDVVCVVFKPTF